MKILHVWDQAGVACILTKYQNKGKHTSHVIKQAGHDPFGFLKFYGGKEWTSDEELNQYLRADYDVFHLHSYRFVANRIRAYHPKAKIILEYHGTDARGAPEADRRKDEAACDLVLISTPDLIEWVPNGLWLPIPVDTEHFIHWTNTPRKSLFMKSNAYNIPNDIPFEFDILKPQPYSKLPQIFSGYDTYIDIQDHKENKLPIQSHSKTGLEALASGMTLYTYDREFMRGLPSWHHPENVIKRLDYFYNLV